MYLFSVIIPHYNSVLSLKRLIDSIPVDPSVQLIIVDDKSSEDVSEIEHWVHARNGLFLHIEALDSGTKDEYMYNGEDGLRQFLLRGKVYVAAWAKLYKRELFKNVTFPYGRINEDHCTTYKVVYRSKRTFCLDCVLYWHRMREESIMHTSFSKRNIELANVADEIRAFLKKDQYLFKNEIDYYEYKRFLKEKKQK